ncbi:MAG: hypothetical protein JRI40_09195 [Deltaproteobacteria bacterium]|nr:hypothetical protein [Deltaproteobacteria bacterium]
MNLPPPPEPPAENADINIIRDYVQELQKWNFLLYEFLKKPVFPGGLNVGDTTNYCQIANDGEITFVGTGRSYVCVMITSHLEHGSTSPDHAVVGNYCTWKYDIGDDSSFVIEVPHWADTSEAAEIHVAWCIDEAYAASKEVQWQVDYSCTPHDKTEAIDNPTHNGQLKSGDVKIPVIAKGLEHTNIGDIPAAHMVDHDIIGIKFSRIAIDDGDNPAQDPNVINVHIRFIKKQLGEAT